MKKGIYAGAILALAIVASWYVLPAALEAG
jgi:hypothetical protein